MKAIKILAATALVAFAAISCKEDEVVTPSYDNGAYVGVMSVEYQGENYDNENIQVNMAVAEDGTLTMDIKQIKFVPQMPVTVDITVPGIAYTEKDGVVTFSGDNIVPLTGVKPVERYLVTGLTGRIEDGHIEFSLNFGSFPTSYAGDTIAR